MAAASRQAEVTPGATVFKDRSARSLTAAVCEALRREILAGRLPPGSRLKIADLGERFGVAGAAVREGLSRLSADGLVEFEDQRGFRVKPVSPRDLADITAVRIYVEQEALRLAFARGDSDWEASVVAAHHRLRATEVFQRNVDAAAADERARRHREFHEALVAACASPTLLRFHRMLYEQTERYRRLSVRYMANARNRHRRTIDSHHRQLMECALTRDTRRAARLIATHFEFTTRQILEAERGERASVILATP